MKITPCLRLVSVLLLTVGLAVAGGFTAPTDAQQTTFDCSGVEDCSALAETFCSWVPEYDSGVFGPCDDGNGDLGFISCVRTGFFCRMI